MGFRVIRLCFELESPAPREGTENLITLTERYWVVLQTLVGGVDVSVTAIDS